MVVFGWYVEHTLPGSGTVMGVSNGSRRLSHANIFGGFTSTVLTKFGELDFLNFYFLI